MSKTIISYKGFDKDFKCRGFQYEVGREYETDKAICCEQGFHACPIPIDVFSYYPPNTSQYAVVEQSGDFSENEDKIASTKIKIKAKLSLGELIKAQVDWIFSNVKKTKKKNEDNSIVNSTGYQSAATNTGYQSAATNTGYQSVATNTGYQSAATNTGAQSAATNTGDRSAATNTGDRSAATNTGYQSAATNTGDRSAATNTGAQSAATNTGDRSAAEVKGKYAVALACGIGSRAKADENGCIVICDWRINSDKWVLDNIYSAKVGGKIKRKTIKANTWYWFKKGKLMEEEE